MAYTTTPGSSLLGTVVLAGALALAGCAPDTPQARAAAGKELLQKKDYRGAVVQFKSALQLDPESAEGRFLLGQALLEAGDPIGAAVELTRALKSNYPADKVLPVLGRALLVNGEEKKLTSQYGEVALSEHQAAASLKASVATAWFTLGNPVKAKKAIADSLAAVPGYGPALTLQARDLSELGKFNEALALIDNVLKADPSLFEAWTLRGEVLLAGNNDAKGAEDSLRKALAIAPTYIPAHLSIVAIKLRASDLEGARAQADQLRTVLPKHPQTQYVDAQVAFAGKEFAKVREMVQLLMRLAPTNVGILQMAGAVEGQLGALVQAENFFNRALAIDPELALARRNLARIYLRQGQFNRALAVLKPLLASKSTDAEALSFAGQASMANKDMREAEAFFRRAAAASPDDQRVRTQLAMSKLGRGDVATAMAELESLASGKTTEIYAEQALVGLHLRRGELDQALEVANSIVAKQAGNPTVFETLGQVQTARKNFPAARAAYEQSLKLDPALFASTAALATIDMAEGKPEQAKQRFQAAIKAAPNDPYARQALAALLTRTSGPPDEIKALLVDAIKAAPTDASARLQLIELALQRRQFKDALAAAQEAASALPTDTRVLEAVGRAQMEAGNVEQSINTFRALIGLDPKSPLPYLRLADVYLSAGRLSEAEVILKRSLDVQPGFAPTQAALLKLLVKTKRPEEAVAFARRIQAERPQDSSGYVLEAAFHLNQKSPDQAFAAYQRGLARNPANPELGLGNYRLLRDQKRAADADRFAATWLKAHPNDSSFEYQVAMTHVLRNEPEQAETRFKSVLAQFPNHPLVLTNLASLLLAQGKPGALPYAQRAVDALPGKPVLMDTLAMALLADNKANEALVLQKRTVELAPTDDRIRFNLARIAAKAGDKPLARKELERLRALGERFGMQTEVTELLGTL